MQGNWLNNAATPFERPKELEGRASLTDAEVVELNKRAKKIFVTLRKTVTGDDKAMATKKIAWCNKALKLPEADGATD